MEDKHKYILARDIDKVFIHVELLYNELKKIKRRVYYRQYYRKRKEKMENIKKKILNESSDEMENTERTQQNKNYVLYFD